MYKNNSDSPQVEHSTVFEIGAETRQPLWFGAFVPFFYLMSVSQGQEPITASCSVPVMDPPENEQP